MGNYNSVHKRQPAAQNYTTTRENGELQPLDDFLSNANDYTTTRENGELQHGSYLNTEAEYYTTTRENGGNTASNSPLILL